MIGASLGERRNRRGAWRSAVALLCVATGGYFGFEPAPSGATPYATRDIVGSAYVIDGDTIDIRRVRIRLYGVDAPEASQQCTNAAGRAYSCGRISTRALDDMVRGKTVRCEQLDTDRYRRAVAICTANGLELNAALVEEGLAVAYRQYSHRYVQNEDRARAARRGLWAGSFEVPGEYRHAAR